MISEAVTVSNGREFYRINAGDLAGARQDGFYRPIERGQTIVGNREHLFEIPVEDLAAARRDGFRDLLAAERIAWQRKQQRVASPPALPTRPGALPRSGAPESMSLFAGLSQAEIEAEEARQQALQELEETEGWRWYALWMRMWLEERRLTLLNQLRSGGVSLAVHVAILLILASLFLKFEEEKGLILTAAPAPDRVVEEVIIEPTPLEITEPTEETDSEAAPEEAAAMTEAVTTPDFLAAVQGDAIQPPAKPAVTPAEGKERPAKKPTFFGSKVSAVNYVFVIDNSNSMTNGRFETALSELVLAVDRLTPKQRFYVIFYSDTAYPLFHPNAAPQLVPATPKNKVALRYWLDTVQLCLKTNGKEAIQAAFNLEPDVIFVLGDGAFTDGASKYFAERPQRKIPLHTLGMEVKPKDAEGFRKLAKTNGGTYKDVGVYPAAREFAKRNPRRRNTVRGPIWGLRLNPAPKLK